MRRSKPLPTRVTAIYIWHKFKKKCTTELFSGCKHFLFFSSPLNLSYYIVCLCTLKELSCCFAALHCIMTDTLPWSLVLSLWILQTTCYHREQLSGCLLNPKALEKHFRPKQVHTQACARKSKPPLISSVPWFWGGVGVVELDRSRRRWRILKEKGACLSPPLSSAPLPSHTPLDI